MITARWAHTYSATYAVVIEEAPEQLDGWRIVDVLWNWDEAQAIALALDPAARLSQ